MLIVEVIGRGTVSVSVLCCDSSHCGNTLLMLDLESYVMGSNRALKALSVTPWSYLSMDGFL